MEIEGFRLVETRDGVKSWCLSAAKAEVLDEEDEIRLFEVTLTHSNLTLTAGQGVVEGKDRLQLSNNVMLRSEEGFCFTAERALWEREKKRIKLMGKVSYSSHEVVIKVDYAELHGELDNLERVIGLGNVEIKDLEDDLVIRGEEVEYHIGERRGVVKGNVHITQEDVVARCGEVLFFGKEGRLVLLGAPQLIQGRNRLSGEKIIIYEGKIEVIGSVSAVFFPKEEESVVSKGGGFE
jgi:lipopolysaccharide export system protein LptA